jgi:hypothetical protein
MSTYTDGNLEVTMTNSVIKLATELLSFERREASLDRYSSPGEVRSAILRVVAISPSFALADLTLAEEELLRVTVVADISGREDRCDDDEAEIGPDGTRVTQ